MLQRYTQIRKQSSSVNGRKLNEDLALGVIEENKPVTKPHTSHLGQRASPEMIQRRL